MQMLQFLLIAAAYILAPHAHAQVSLCSGPAVPGFVGLGFLGLHPPMPDSAQIVAIDVGRIAYNPLSVSTQIQGNVVNVTLTGSFIVIGVPPPIACLSTTVGPLAPGAYTVNAYLTDAAFPTAPPSLFLTTALSVLPAPIPASSMSTLAMLAALVAFGGLHALRLRP